MWLKDQHGNLHNLSQAETVKTASGHVFVVTAIFPGGRTFPLTKPVPEAEADAVMQSIFRAMANGATSMTL